MSAVPAGPDCFKQVTSSPHQRGFLTEAQLEAADKAYHFAKTSGALAREQGRIALQQQINEGGSL